MDSILAKGACEESEQDSPKLEVYIYIYICDCKFLGAGVPETQFLGAGVPETQLNTFPDGDLSISFEYNYYLRHLTVSKSLNVSC